MKRLVIIGAGGFGREAAWIIGRMSRAVPGLEIAGFCDDAADKQKGLIGAYPLLGRTEEAAARGVELFFCAIGTNRARQAAFASAIAAGMRPVRNTARQDQSGSEATKSSCRVKRSVTKVAKNSPAGAAV